MTLTGSTLGKITIKRFNYWPNQAKDYCYLATIKDVTFFSFSTHSLFFLLKLIIFTHIQNRHATQC